MMGLPKHVFSGQRIGAMVLRGSWPRIVEQAYWPTVQQMVIWGLVTRFFVTNGSWVAEAVLIALCSCGILFPLTFKDAKFS